MAMDKLGYVIDLGKYNFAEIDVDDNTWVQAMPLGKTYKHPIYGQLTFDHERLQRYADNFAAGVRGQDLDINFDHGTDPARGKEAAGWIRDVAVRDSGLFLLVDWTPDALQGLKDKKWRYFSPEFVKMWEHPESGVKFNDVLFGGALTNRPFLKGMEPVNLSELSIEEDDKDVKELIQKLAQALGIEIPEDADEDKAAAMLSEAIVKLQETPDPPKPDDKDDPLKLADLDPEVQKLFETQQAQILALTAANRVAATERAVAKLSEGRKYAIPPAQVTKLHELLVTLSEDAEAKVLEVVENLLSEGLIELGERGGNGGDDHRAEDAPAEVLKRIAKLREDDKDLTEVDAANMVFAEDPSLYEAYAKASRIKED